LAQLRQNSEWGCRHAGISICIHEACQRNALCNAAARALLKESRNDTVITRAQAKVCSGSSLSNKTIQTPRELGCIYEQSHAQTYWLAKALYSLSPAAHQDCQLASPVCNEIRRCEAVAGLSNLRCRSPGLGRRSCRMRLVPTTAWAWVYSRCQLL